MRRLLALLAAALLAGCASGGARLAAQDFLQLSEGAHDAAAGAYQVDARGRVANLGAEPARGVRLLLGVAADCRTAPAFEGFFELGSLAAGSSIAVQERFAQPSPRLAEPKLWYRVMHGEARVADQGCGVLLAA